MAWHKVDWLDVQVFEFDTALIDSVRAAYRAAHSVLESTSLARKKWYEQEAENSTNESGFARALSAEMKAVREKTSKPSQT